MSASSPAAVNLQLQRLRELRKYVKQQVLKQLVHAFIVSTLDYCNSILAGLSKYAILRLHEMRTPPQD